VTTVPASTEAAAAPVPPAPTATQTAPAAASPKVKAAPAPTANLNATVPVPVKGTTATGLLVRVPTCLSPFPPFKTHSAPSFHLSSGCSPAAASLPLKATVKSLAPQTDGRTNVTLALDVGAAPPAGTTFALAAKAAAGGAAPVDLACTPDGPAAALCTGALVLADPFECLTTPLAVEATVQAVDKAGKRCPAGSAGVGVDACQQ
jgi:hypothetical protein